MDLANRFFTNARDENIFYFISEEHIHSYSTGDCHCGYSFYGEGRRKPPFLCFDIQATVTHAIRLISELKAHAFIVWDMLKFAWAISIVSFQVGKHLLNILLVRIHSYFSHVQHISIASWLSDASVTPSTSSNLGCLLGTNLPNLTMTP